MTNQPSVRLEFRFVFKNASLDEVCQVMTNLVSKYSNIGRFFSSSVDSYSKIERGLLCRIEYDLFEPLPDFKNDIIFKIGEFNWAFDGDGFEQEAIWSVVENEAQPLSKNAFWAQIQFIPYQSLSKSRTSC